MANLEMAVAHNLSQDEALSRIKNLLSDLKRDHGDKISNLKEDWNENVGTFAFSSRGFDIAGTLVVTPSAVELNGKIPFAVSLFKGQIIKVIEERAKKILA